MDLGYEGHHILRIEDTEKFAVYNKSGKVVVFENVELIGNSFEDCQGLMLDADLDPAELLTNLSVTKIHAGRVVSSINTELAAI